MDQNKTKNAELDQVVEEHIVKKKKIIKEAKSMSLIIYQEKVRLIILNL